MSRSAAGAPRSIRVGLSVRAPVAATLMYNSLGPVDGHGRIDPTGPTPSAHRGITGAWPLLVRTVTDSLGGSASFMPALPTRPDPTPDRSCPHATTRGHPRIAIAVATAAPPPPSGPTQARAAAAGAGCGCGAAAGAAAMDPPPDAHRRWRHGRRARPRHG